MNGLLPCPFCGSSQILVKTRKTTMVECGDCGVVLFDCQDGVHRDPIKAWNTRVFTAQQTRAPYKVENMSSEKCASFGKDDAP